MARTVDTSSTFEQWRQNYNNLATDVGDPAGLRTGEKDSLVNAVNYIQDQYFFFQDFDFDGVDGATSNTIFSGTDNNGNTLQYASQKVLVYKNGLLLRNGTDYTAVDGVNVNLASSASNADVIRISSYTGSYTTTPAGQESLFHWQTAGANIFNRNTGGMVFNAGTAVANAVTAPTVANTFQFEGPIYATEDIYINAQKDLRFRDADSSHYVAVQSPTTVAANWTLTLPAVDGDSGQFFRTDGSGNVTWVTETTYSTSAVNSGDNVIVRLTGAGQSSGTDDLTLVAGTNMAIEPSGDNITFTSTDTNTTYDFSTTNGSNPVLTLDPSSGSDDVVTMTGGQSITTTGSSTNDVSIAVTDNSISALQINVSGNGNSGEALVTDGDGSFSYAAFSGSNTTYTHEWVDSSANAILRLVPSAGGNDDLTIVAGSGITLTPSGDNLTIAAAGGTAANVTVADESSDTTCFPLFVTAATGDLPPKSGSNLAFNSSSGILTAGGFAGPLTGAVTGNASTATTAATWTTSRTLSFTGEVTGSGSVNGSANVATALTIAGDAIDESNIADNAIDSEHYTDGSIDLIHMSANSVDSAQYVDGSIDLVHLDAGMIQLASESFADNDTSLMTSAAIQDKILAYGYTTDTGDITGVTAGSGMSGGGTSGTVTLTNAGVTSIVAGSNISISGATGAVTVTGTDTNTQYTAGGGLTLSSLEFSHTDTSSQASVDNSGQTFIQDIALDTYGHITSITSAAASDANTWRTVTAGGETLSTSETLAFTAGTNVSITESAGAVTINSTDQYTGTTTPSSTETFTNKTWNGGIIPEAKLQNQSGTNTGDQTTVSGLAGSATILANGRTIAMSGDVVWNSGSFNGSANVTAAATIQASAVDLAMLSASGTRNTTTFYRGDGTFAVPPDTNTGDVNQNAFSNVLLGGSTTLAADSATDTLNINPGTGISLTGTVGTDTLVINLANDRRNSSSSTDIWTGNNHDYIFFDASVGMDFYVNNSNEMRLEDDGDLHVDGDIIAFSGTTASDIALKENINPITNALDKVIQLGGYTFDWKDKKRGSSTGLIAQEVEKVLPELVKNPKGFTNHKTLNYNGIIGLLVESIKELKREVESLKNSKT